MLTTAGVARMLRVSKERISQKRGVSIAVDTIDSCGQYEGNRGHVDEHGAALAGIAKSRCSGVSPGPGTCIQIHGSIGATLAMQPAIYQTVPQRMPPVLFTEGQADLRKTAVFLQFSSAEFARVIGTPKKAVRLDAQTAEAVRARLTEIATICALVMDFFGGDLDKTHLWFMTRNPLLGNISPREMIRLGLYRRVLRFVQEARAQEPSLAA